MVGTVSKNVEGCWLLELGVLAWEGHGGAGEGMFGFVEKFVHD